MKRKRMTYSLIIVLLFIFSIVFTKLDFAIKPNIDHESDIYNNNAETKYSNIEIDKLPTDYIVNKNFESQLPLVIIETEGNEIPNAYTYNKKEERFVLKKNQDPYVDGKISIIDNKNKINKLSDNVEVSSKIKIKYRGNSSLVYDKHQYRIKLINDNGESNKVDIMGMGADEDWILNISMIDSTLLRNYLVYTISKEIMEYTPDVKYCEVITKSEEGYRYDGVYLMMENIKQEKNRVDISEYNPKNNYTSYLLRRDRYDEEDNMLEGTYALNNKLGYGILSIRYPSDNKLDQKAYDYIYRDIDNIERILYSNDEDIFMTYPNYIDEDSFVDYFIINEFFANYDAGNNSTYMYKDVGGKLKIGPVWDYDNAMDNIGKYMLDPTMINFEGQTWFDRLVRSERFCDKLEKRYKELSKTTLSNEHINKIMDDTIKYIGKAQVRDWDRWNEQYTKDRFDLLKDNNGIVVDRNYKTYKEEVQRLKDILFEHSLYIEKNLQKLKDESIYKQGDDTYEGLAIVFICIFLSSVVIARRYN